MGVGMHMCVCILTSALLCACMNTGVCMHEHMEVYVHSQCHVLGSVTISTWVTAYKVSTDLSPVYFSKWTRARFDLIKCPYTNLIYL